MSRLLTYPELKALKGVSFSNVHLKRLEDLEQFPGRIKTGSGSNGSVAWLESEIDQWIEEKINAGRQTINQ